MIKGYKAHDDELKCRGHQFEVGQSYEIEGDVQCCSNGYHFCEQPFDVLSYYPLNGSRFTIVTGDGDVSRDTDDSKVAVGKLTIEAEITLPEFVKDAATTGNWAHAATTGDEAHAATTGREAHAATTGRDAHAATTGESSVASGLGFKNKAKASDGGAICLTEFDNDGKLIAINSSLVGENGVKPDTWYELVNGQFKECEK